MPMADRCLKVLPESVSDDAAVFVADMLPTGYSAVRRADLTLGDVVVVVGCGTVGQMAIIFATRIARTVIAVDESRRVGHWPRNRRRRRGARRCSGDDRQPPPEAWGRTGSSRPPAAPAR